jgi:hypothetical protein
MLTMLAQDHNFRLVTDSTVAYTVRESHFDLVLLMSNVAARTVTLPSGPADRQKITIRDAADTALTAPITITSGAIPSDIASINVNGDAVTLIYDQPSNKWLFDGAALDDRFILTDEVTNTYSLASTQLPSTVMMSFNGARTFNLPASPVDGQRIIIVDSAGVASDSTKTISIAPAGGKTSDVATIDLNNDAVSLVYKASLNRWKSTNMVEARYYEVVEATATYNLASTGHTTYVLMSNIGTRTVNLPASPVSGQRVVIKDNAATAATSAITITPAGGKTCEVAAISTNGGAADLMYNASLNSWRSLVSLPITYSAENLIDLTATTGKAISQDSVVQIVSGAGVESLSIAGGTLSSQSAGLGNVDGRAMTALTTSTNVALTSYQSNTNVLLRTITFNGTNTPTVGAAVTATTNSYSPTGAYFPSVALFDDARAVLATTDTSQSANRLIPLVLSGTNNPVVSTNEVAVSLTGYGFAPVASFPNNTNNCIYLATPLAGGGSGIPRLSIVTTTGTNSISVSAYTSAGTNALAGGSKVTCLTSNTGVFTVRSTSNGESFCGAFTFTGTNAPSVTAFTSLGVQTLADIERIDNTTAFYVTTTTTNNGFLVYNGTNAPTHVTNTSLHSALGTNTIANFDILAINNSRCVYTYRISSTDKFQLKLLQFSGTNTPTVSTNSNYGPGTNVYDDAFCDQMGDGSLSLSVKDTTASSSHVYRLSLPATVTGTTIGIARSTALGGNPVSVSAGPIVTGLAGLTVGAKYYAQDGSSLLGTTVTSIYVGVALTTTKLLLQL